MSAKNGRSEDEIFPAGDRTTLAHLPLPAKALVASILFTLAIAMVGAVGQIVVHDIIPTVFSERENGMGRHASGNRADERGPTAEMQKEPDKASRKSHGDLFAEMPVREENADKPFYENDQFVWTLKWTHIHLFGMNMIFIFLGSVTFMLDMSARRRTLLIVLPFVGIVVDIASMWLKGFVSPAFFWLHIPGGGLFGAVFLFVFFRANFEMFRRRKK